MDNNLRKLFEISKNEKKNVPDIFEISNMRCCGNYKFTIINFIRDAITCLWKKFFAKISVLGWL